MSGRDATRTGGVMAAINARIAARTLLPGERLPSIRTFAATLGVSKSTVVEAYDRLVADGVIRSRPGAGFHVAGPLAPLTLGAIGPRRERDVDPLWISRQALEPDPGTALPGCGWLPPDWMPDALVRAQLRRLSRAETATLTDYGAPLGLAPLRQVLARRLGEQGIEAAADQIVLTHSGTQAIDLICRFLIEPGDAVLVDDPCYFNFHALLKAHRATVVGVPYTPQGPDLDRFASALRDHRPRLYITNSAVHNPTGATLSPVVAHRLLKLADEAGLVIVEDDIFGDFERAGVAKLAAFDGLDRVVHVGSFSKTLSAAARCGYIAARQGWIEGLVDLKIATSFGGAGLTAHFVLAMLKDAAYRRHLDQLRLRLDAAREQTAARLRAIGIVPWTMPQAGMFLWGRLPDGADAAVIGRRALADGVVLAPGNAFSPAQTARSYLRFNVAQCGERRTYDVLQRAMERGEG